MGSLSAEVELLMTKFAEVEAMRLHPDNYMEVPFCFTVAEGKTMARLWERELIVPTGPETATFTAAGVAEGHRLWR